MSEIQWYYEVEQNCHGPVGVAEIADQLNKDTITGISLVWRRGLSDWQVLQRTELPSQLQYCAGIGQEKQISIPTLWWFIEKNNELHGPLTTDALTESVRSGALNLQTPVWREGMITWQPLCHTGLAVVLASKTAAAAPVAPPPLPWLATTDGQAEHLLAADTFASKQMWRANGWLKFFCISIAGLQPLINLAACISLVNSFLSAWLHIGFELKLIMVVQIAFVIGIGAHGINAGKKLWQGNRQGIRLAKSFLVLNVVVDAFMTLLWWYGYRVSGIPGNVFNVESLLGGFLKTCVFASIWLSFLSHSENVADMPNGAHNAV